MSIVSKAATNEYREGFDRVFGNREPGEAEADRRPFDPARDPPFDEKLYLERVRLAETWRTAYPETKK